MRSASRAESVQWAQSEQSVVFERGLLLSERGSVTAEFATVLPAVVLVLAMAVGGMQVAGEQLRLQSAVADAARLLGRGDPAAGARVSAVAPGARLGESRQGVLVCATGQAPTSLGVLLGITLSATSCALDDAAPG
jgi:Flp pilus assembly protein TadG